MIGILRNRTYARLFAAQVVALVGTGLMTVALGLLAYDLAGEAAGVVLGTAYAIKMIAYVGLSPVAAAAVTRLPRKAVLVGADMLRAAVALMLPFAHEAWHVYALIFLLQAASATFTPAFQATIPDVVPDEAEYTRALSLSRLAYELENLASPTLAALLLSVIGYHWLFSGTTIGFLASATLVLAAGLPPQAPHGAAGALLPFSKRVTRGTRIYLATPRLRGLLALTLAGAAGSAFVIVNTVLIVRAGFGLGESALAQAMAAFGAGSVLAALALPRILDRVADRSVMMPAGLVLSAVMLGLAAWLGLRGLPGWPAFLLIWAVGGALYAAIAMPSGRLLRRSARPPDRAAVFTAHFALSHACWLVTYPLAGFVGQAFGLPAALTVLGVVALAGAALALRVWPADDPAVLAHDHPGLPADHPHLAEHPARGGRHAHDFVIDDEHPVWPGAPLAVSGKRP